MRYNYREVSGTYYLNLWRMMTWEEIGNLFAAMGAESGDFHSNTIAPWASDCGRFDIENRQEIVSRIGGRFMVRLRQFLDSLP